MDDQRRIGPSFTDAAGLDEELERFRQIALLSPRQKERLYELRLAGERKKAAIHEDYTRNWRAYVAEEERDLRREKPTRKFVPRHWLNIGGQQSRRPRQSREQVHALAVSKAREKYDAKIAAVNVQVREREDIMLKRKPARVQWNEAAAMTRTLVEKFKRSSGRGRS